MSGERTCVDCGAPLPPKTGEGRPSLRCAACRLARIRAGDRQYARTRYWTDPEFRKRKKAVALRSYYLRRSLKDTAERD